MYNKNFKKYTIEIPKFEEKYYEDLLHILSKCNRFTILNHDSGSQISKCYTEKCCAYTGHKKGKCEIGIGGDDKFISMLKGTIFENLLVMAERM